MKMRMYLLATAIAAGLSASASAQVPAGATGLCRDGSYSSAAKKAGACGGHQGVQTWYAASTAGSPAVSPVSAPASAAPAVSQPVAQTTAAPVSKAAVVSAPAAAAPSSSTGAAGPGMVWVNTSTKVYHCPGTQFYGKTKAGKYVSEADAKAEGDHGNHGKTCSQ